MPIEERSAGKTRPVGAFGSSIDCATFAGIKFLIHSERKHMTEHKQFLARSFD
jgi:hypothetical protein